MNAVIVFPQTLSRKIAAAALLIFSLSFLFSIHFIANSFQPSEFYGRLINNSAPAFNLQDIDGNQVGLEDFRGGYVYLMFGYLNCDRTCHTQVLVMDQLSKLAQGDDVHYVYISMDPARDDMNKLKFYFKENSELTILKDENIRKLQSIANSFGVPFSVGPADEAANYEVSHPGYIFLINPEGEIRIVYSGNHIDTDRMFNDLSLYKSQFS